MRTDKKEKIRNFKTAAVIAAVFVSICMVQCSPDEKEDDPVPSSPAAPKMRFVADWSCTEVSNSHGTAFPFQVHCTSGSGDTVLLENFYAMGYQHKAKAVVRTDSIIIAPNNQQFSGVLVLEGRGKLVNSSKFTMTYRVNDGSILDTITATFTK